MPKYVINGKFLTQKVTGVQRYAREIVNELDKIVEYGYLEIAVPSETNNIPDYKNIEVVKIGTLTNQAWEHITFPIYVKKRKATSINLCNVAPLLSPGIVCIHDVKIKARPHDFSKKFLFWYRLLFLNSIKRSKFIITVSNFSRQEICKYYHVPFKKVYVVPNSWQHYKKIEFDENTLTKFGLEKRKYFFSLGSLEPNKNFKWIAEIAKKNSETIFAVAGSINKNVFADGLGFECPNNIKLLGYVSDGQAKTLMRDCKAFLFPTFYEGFGIPPLETISAGANCVIVSDTSIMHEIFGGYVNYIDPTNYNIEIEKFVKINVQNAKVLLKYSWNKSAKIMNALLNNFLIGDI